MKSLNYYRRFIATAFAFVLFGVVGVLLKVVLLPYTLNSTRNDLARQLQARRLIGGVWKWFTGYRVK